MKLLAVQKGGEKRPYEITSVVRACQVLLAFGETDEVLQLRDVAARVRLSRPTTFRLLVNLEREGILERVGKRGYRPRFRLLESRAHRIGYAAQSAVGPFIGTVTDSIQFAARSAGLDIVILNNKASRRVALQNADEFIRRGVELVIEFQLMEDVAAEVSARFGAAGIPMIALDNPHPGAIYFGADNYRAGHLAGTHLGRWAAQNWQGKAEQLVLIDASLGGSILQTRVRGITDGVLGQLSGCGQLPVVHLDSRRGRFDLSLEAVRRHLQRTKANRILVGAVNDVTALGVIEAFREFGRGHECAVVGQDCVLEARQEMRKPGARLVGTTAYFPETYGERLIPLVRDVLRGRATPRAVYTKHQLVTPANVDRIYANDLLG